LLLKVEVRPSASHISTILEKNPGATSPRAYSLLEAKGMVEAHPPPPSMKKRTLGFQAPRFLDLMNHNLRLRALDHLTT
jgi:hypothetical protein